MITHIVVEGSEIEFKPAQRPGQQGVHCVVPPDEENPDVHDRQDAGFPAEGRIYPAPGGLPLGLGTFS